MSKAHVNPLNQFSQDVQYEIRSIYPDIPHDVIVTYWHALPDTKFWYSMTRHSDIDYVDLHTLPSRFVYNKFRVDVNALTNISCAYAKDINTLFWRNK